MTLSLITPQRILRGGGGGEREGEQDEGRIQGVHGEMWNRLDKLGGSVREEIEREAKGEKGN